MPPSSPSRRSFSGASDTRLPGGELSLARNEVWKADTWLQDAAEVDEGRQRQTRRPTNRAWNPAAAGPQAHGRDRQGQAELQPWPLRTPSRSRSKKRRILGRPGQAPPPEAPKPEPVAEFACPERAPPASQAIRAGRDGRAARSFSKSFCARRRSSPRFPRGSALRRRRARS